MGLDAAVFSLTRPSGAAPMEGPEPTVDGLPLSPLDTWYGDHLYWFDRMVRSGHQLVERLALVFHDWWATTNDAVGSNALMLDQTNVFRQHGLGSFREHDAGDDDRPGDARLPQRDRQPQAGGQRELRPRADGAVHARRGPRRLHGDRRARARPRADGLARRLVRRRGPARLPLRRHALGQRLQDRVRPHRRVHVGGRVLAGRRAPAARLVLRGEAVELLHPGAAVRGRRGRARARLRRLGPPDPPGARGDPALPGALRRAAADQAARRAAGRHAARARAHDHRRGVGLAQRRAPASGSTTRPTSRAGTTSAGWTPTRSARAGTSSTTSSPAARSTRARPPPAPTRPRRPSRRSPPPARSGWTRGWSRRPPPGCSRTRSSSSRPPTTRAPRSTGASSARRRAPSARTPSDT